MLNDKLHGFYRSQYTDAAGKTFTIATTQFEATDARRALPCWDEPALKAVFKVTLVVDENLTALSNAGIANERSIGGGKKEVVFKDTIRMSTYLLAFIIGEFEATAVTDAGTPLRVVHVPGKHHLANYAQAIGAFSLKFFADYYGIPYPGDKLDLIAIPDFAAGAMENLGAITFRETALLADDKTASRAELERIADVVSHENAHMWFGDLVTMKWWNGIWLNEAFATFMEMLAVDAWKPEWRRWDSFGASRSAAMAIDALKNTRSIEYTVLSPEDCRSMFDILTYEKGASVLRMLEQYLGAERFRKGIALLSQEARVRQRRDQRSVGWAGGGQRRTRPQHDGHLDFPARFPDCQRGAYGRWARSQVEPAPFLLGAAGRARTSALAYSGDGACWDRSGHQNP